MHRSSLLRAAVAAALAAACTDDPAPPRPIDNSGLLPGMAVAKFCHELTRAGANVDLTIELGQPVIARISARTSACTPPLDQACIPIPVGLVPLRLLEGEKVHAVGLIELQANLEYLLAAVIGSTGPTIRTRIFLPEARCAQTNPFRSDGGTDGGASDAPDGGGDAGTTDAPDGGGDATDGGDVPDGGDAPDGGASDSADADQDAAAGN